MLFISVLKSLKDRKLIIIILIMIISLTITIYNTLNLSFDSLEKTYNDYLEKQNVEHVYLSVNNNYNDLKYQDIDFSLVDTSLKKTLLNFLYNPNTLSYFEVEDIKKLLDKMDVFKTKQIAILKSLQAKYHFTYELQQNKIIKQKKNNLILFNLKENKNINKPKLIKGRWPKENGEIVADKSFKINSTYLINQKKYKIVGIIYSPVYIYPMINVLNSLEDRVIYLTNDDFNLITGILNSGFAIKFDNYKRKMDFNEDNNDIRIKLLKENNIDYNIDTITRTNRVNYLKQEIENNRVLAKYFLTLLLGISIFINFIMIKKIIDSEKNEIGNEKALGFSKIYIASSYLVYPIVTIILGSIIGLIVSSLLVVPFTNLYGIGFNIPITNYVFNFNYFKQIIKFYLLLPLFTMIISFYLVRKKSLSLLKEGSNIKVNILTKIINRIFYLFPFDYKFKLSLAFRSLGKLIVIIFIILGASLLIVFSLIISNLFNQIVDSSFENMKFKYLIIFNSSLTDSEDGDYLFNVTGSIKNKEEINVIGIDNKTKYFKVTDKKINQNEIVINENLKNKYNLKLDDYLIIKIGNREYKYKIIDVTKGNTEIYGYVNRLDLSKKVGYKKIVYNEMYSNDNKYMSMDNLPLTKQDKISTILNINDLKNNLKKQMKNLTASIYFITIFSLLITFLVIVVIAYVIIDENKTNIALLKIMGYSDKKISKLVLNIYTPFIFITYFISIPIIKEIIKLVINDIEKQLDMVFLVTISIPQIILGLIILLGIYFLAIRLNKSKLEKIPLEIILKESR